MKRLVIVDDDPSTRVVARLFAEEEGWEVVGEASDGLEGVTLARRHVPDVVIMDYRMPGLDGVRATRRIARSRPQVAVIGWTSDGDAAVGDAFLAAGAQAFVAKGDFTALRVLLRAALPA
jgi:DNA-binding NarL/FixJ family response regulator